MTAPPDAADEVPLAGGVVVSVGVTRSAPGGQSAGHVSVPAARMGTVPRPSTRAPFVARAAELDVLAAAVERARAERGVRAGPDLVQVDPERRERGAVERVEPAGGVDLALEVGRTHADRAERGRPGAALLPGERQEQVHPVDGVVAALPRDLLGADHGLPGVGGEAFEHVTTSSWCGTRRTSCARPDA